MQPDTGIRAFWGRAWPGLLAVGTVGAVGAPAAVASYWHARDVVAAHGDPVMAPWLPLSVDGMLVAALVVIWVRQHRGDRAGVFPWCAFSLGMVVTVLANLAAVREPSPVAFAVALFPPIALAVTRPRELLVEGDVISRMPKHHAYVLGLAPRPAVVRWTPGYELVKTRRAALGLPQDRA